MVTKRKPPEQLLMDFRPPEQRFWKFVDKQGGVPQHMPHLGHCWRWTGGKSKNGYGAFKVRGKQMGAHQFAFSFLHGRDRGGLLVLHHCDNPLCVNPDHLFLGTTQDNVDDKVRKGRARCAATGKLDNGMRRSV